MQMINGNWCRHDKRKHGNVYQTKTATLRIGIVKAGGDRSQARFEEVDNNFDNRRTLRELYSRGRNNS